MHGELVNAVHTAVRCQMCVLERTLKNGKTIFIKILRNDIRMSCTEPGLCHSTCWVQIHSVVFLTPKPQISALRSSPYRRHYSAFFCCSEMSSEKLLFYPENVSRASYYELFAADENQKNPLQFPLCFYFLLRMVTPSLQQKLLVPATVLFTHAQLSLQINMLPGIIWMSYSTVLHMQ